MSDSTTSNSKSPAKERKRAVIACVVCRARKLKCNRSSDPCDKTPCQRCTTDGLVCEYRAVESGSASNNLTHDDTVNLDHVSSASPANQPGWFQGPASNHLYQPSVPLQANPLLNPTPHYATPPGHYATAHYGGPQYQQYPSHSTSHQGYAAFPSTYVTGQPSYQPSHQFSSHHPNQPMSYHAPGPGSYDHRVSDTYNTYNYGDQTNGSQSTTEE